MQSGRWSSALIEDLGRQSPAPRTPRREGGVESPNRRSGATTVPARRRRSWSESSSLHAAPEFHVVRRWVATLSQRAVVPWEGGTVSLMPATDATRAAVAIEASDAETPHRKVDEPGDLSCDLLFGTSAIGDDELARMQRVADECPAIYAPNLTAGVALLRLLAKLSTRVEVVDGPHADPLGGADAGRASGRRHDLVQEPGLRLAALRLGDGADEQTLFVAVPANRCPRPPTAAAHRAFAPKILDAAAFVASAERRLRGLSALMYR